VSETGKSVYAPRYSIAHEVIAQCPNCGNHDCEEIEAYKKKIQTQWLENQRLRDAVVEAAKAVTNVYKNKGAYSVIGLERLLKVTDDLLQFEQEHKS
jgi:hypothetical protein